MSSAASDVKRLIFNREEQCSSLLPYRESTISICFVNFPLLALSFYFLLLLFSQGNNASHGPTARLKDKYFSLPFPRFVCFHEFRCLPGSHPLDYSVSVFSSPQELRLLAPAQSPSHAHSRLTGCNVGATVTHTHTRWCAYVCVSGCGTILSSVGCKCGFPAGEPGKRHQTNEADLQRQRTAIISQGNRKND